MRRRDLDPSIRQVAAAAAAARRDAAAASTAPAGQSAVPPGADITWQQAQSAAVDANEIHTTTSPAGSVRQTQQQVDTIAGQVANLAAGVSTQGRWNTVSTQPPTTPAGYPDGAWWTQVASDADLTPVATWTIASGAWESRPLPAGQVVAVQNSGLITASTIASAIIRSDEFWTSLTNPKVGFNGAGFSAFNAEGRQTLRLDGQNNIIDGDAVLADLIHKRWTHEGDSWGTSYIGRAWLKDWSAVTEGSALQAPHLRFVAVSDTAGWLPDKVPSAERYTILSNGSTQFNIGGVVGDVEGYENYVILDARAASLTSKRTGDSGTAHPGLRDTYASLYLTAGDYALTEGAATRPSAVLHAEDTSIRLNRHWIYQDPSIDIICPGRALASDQHPAGTSWGVSRMMMYDPSTTSAGTTVIEQWRGQTDNGGGEQRRAIVQNDRAQNTIISDLADQPAGHERHLRLDSTGIHMTSDAADGQAAQLWVNASGSLVLDGIIGDGSAIRTCFSTLVGADLQAGANMTFTFSGLPVRPGCKWFPLCTVYDWDDSADTMLKVISADPDQCKIRIHVQNGALHKGKAGIVGLLIRRQAW